VEFGKKKSTYVKLDFLYIIIFYIYFIYYKQAHMIIEFKKK